MARYVKTVTSEGGSSGGGAGVSLEQVCAAACVVIDSYLPKYKGKVGLSTSVVGWEARNCLNECCEDETIEACNSFYPGTDAGLQYATASAGDQMGNWYPLAVCNCWTCCYDRCICLEWSLPTHCYDAFIIRWNGIKIPRCCYFNYAFSFGTEQCYSKGYNWSSGGGKCQYYYCQRPGGASCCTGNNFPYTQYSPIGNGWQGASGFCDSHQCNHYKAIWISGDYVSTTTACWQGCGHRTINLEWQFWRYNNHMSGQARDYGDRFCNSSLSCMADGTPYICAPQESSEAACLNEMWMMQRASFFCCFHHGWNRTYWRPNTNGYCWCDSSAGYGICWNDCCPQCGGRQFSKFILWPCCCLTPHLTSYCCQDQHLNHHSSWCIMGLNKCVPGFEGATPSYGDGSTVKPL